ncbi:MAG: hypothetical protein ACSHYF_06945 [Verrucomicrobiaceae bacterium]
MEPSQALKEFKSALKTKKGVDYQACRILEVAPYLEYTEKVVALMDEALPTAELLTQVAIMDAYYQISKEKFHEEDLMEMLNLAAKMGDEGEALYMAARVALGNLTGLVGDQADRWGDGQIEITAKAVKKRGPGKFATVDHITVIIHGTWASNGKWWRPGGDFFEYVKTDLKRADIYEKSDRYMWSGKNRDGVRRDAAKALNKWLKTHPAREVNVFAHSHGANIAMMATKEGIEMDRLVMLSPPVREDYFADWSKIKKSYNIQASFDPVVAIACGGQWFNPARKKRAKRIPVTEKKMKASGHSASHDPDVWRKENLPSFVEMPWK